MNPSALQRLNRLAASLGIGFVMLVVGWWCLTIEPAAANDRAPENNPRPLAAEQCDRAKDPVAKKAVYTPTFDLGSRFGSTLDRVSSIAVGDLDLDGDLDLVVGKVGKALVTFNDGTGSFPSTQNPVELKYGQAQTTDQSTGVAVTVADMSRNGALDIIMVGPGAPGQIHLNDGQGGFGQIATFGSDQPAATTLAVADLDGDAAFDIVAGYTNGQGVVYRSVTPTTGIITPSFTINPSFGPLTGTITSLATGDLSGDGTPEIVAAYADGPLVIYWNDDPANFPTTTTPSTTLTGPGGGATSLALVDLDGRHGLDLVAAYPGIRLEIYLNDGKDSRKFNRQAAICLLSTDTPVRLAAGDIDNDGRPDLVAGLGQPPAEEHRPFFNRVFLNRSSGTPLKFEHRNFGLAGSDDTRAVALADLNDDGALDLVTGNYEQQSSIFFNGGEGTLRPIPITTGKVFVDNIAVGDVDGKNGPDIVAGSVWEKDELDVAPRLTVYHNDDSGAFSRVVTQPFGALGVETRDVILGDVNQDGALDIVAAVARPDSDGTPAIPNYVYINDGKGTFTSHEAGGSSARPFGTASDNTQSLALGDIDRDGDLDIVAGNKDTKNAVHFNDGSGHFTATKKLFGAADGDTTSLALGDIDLDGYLDVVAGYTYQPAVIYLNDTSGDFTETLSTPIGEGINRTTSVALGDVNGDGALDIALGSLYGANLVYTNDGRGSFPDAGVQALGLVDNSTYDLAFGDVNGDGALDLAATQWDRAVPHRVYLNDGRGHFSTAHARVLEPVAHSPKINPTKGLFSRSLDLADVNRDGNLDIVTGDMYPKASKQHLVVYLNSTRLAAGLLDHPPTVIAEQPIQDATGSVSLAYRVQDRDADLIQRVITQIVPLARQPYFSDILTLTISTEAGSPCPLPDTAEVMTETSSQHAETVFSPNFFGTLHDVAVQMQAYPSYCPQPYRVPGPYQWPHGTTTTPPFSVRGRTIQVNMNEDRAIQVNMNEDRAARAQALVYRLPQGESSGATLVADAQGDVYHPASDGRLEGLGELHPGDQLMALVPAAAVMPHMPSLTFVSPDFQPASLLCPYFAFGSTTVSQCAAAPLNLSLAMSDTRRIIQATLHLDLDVQVPSEVQVHLSTNGCASLEVPRFKVQPGTPPLSFPIPPCLPSGAAGNSKWTLVLTLNDIDRRLKLSMAPQRLKCQWIYISLFDRRKECKPDPYGYGQVHAITVDNWGIEATLSPLHYTSAPLITETVTVTRNAQGVPVTALKPDLTVVSDETPTAALTISRDNPLLLFDLAVALEWDARSDRPFVEQLSANLRRASELLYDWSNGQAALGRITVYHDARAQVRPDGTSPWSDADVRVFATNRLRPNSAQGGIVSSQFADTDNSEITYVPGSVNIAATWNRYGDTAGNLGEDWTRALAHELGHYLFFLNDNYIGVDEQGLLVPVSGCAGVMADPYQTDDEKGYGEYHADDSHWETDCKETLSAKKAGRSDWETITTFYPRLKAPPPTEPPKRSILLGPDILPIEVTQVSESAPVTPTTALEHPVFYLVGDKPKNYTGKETPYVELRPAAGARAFLFKSKPGAPGGYDRVVDLGRPRLDQVLARGAQPGDRLCVTDPEHRRAGCSVMSAAGNDEVKLSILPEEWQPDVVITPGMKRTLAVTVTGLPVVDLVVEGQMFPLDGKATVTQTFRADGTTYSTTFTLTDAVPSGHLLLRIHDRKADHHLVTDLTLGGSPAFVHGKVVHAPVLSNDGQVLLYGPDLNLKNDQVALLHAVTRVPQPPSWATVIGNAYRLAASPGVSLTGASLSFSYLGNEVPSGEEGALNVYRLRDDKSWERLETVRNPNQNVASAAINDQGLYALMSSTEIPLPQQGWNLFGYPVPVTYPSAHILNQAGIPFNVAYGYDPGRSDDPWQVYVPGAPPEVSDLHKLVFGHGYFIYTTKPGTLHFKGASPFGDAPVENTPPPQSPTSDLALLTPPAIVYGKLDIADQAAVSGTMSITATINGSACGQGQTFTNGSETWYAVKIQAASEISPDCGLVGRPVTLILATADGDRTLTPATAAPVKWDNGKPQAITMTLHSADTSPKTPTANCTELLTDGGFESRSAWQLERTANQAKYTTSLAHEGTSSLQLGLTPADPSGSRRAALSSGYQFVRIPDTAPSARLSFWYHTDAPTQGGDYRRVLLLNDSLKLLKDLGHLPAATNAWQEASFDLTPYKGRNVVVYFETRNDNTASAPRTWMAIDDVSLTVCR